MFGSRPNVGSCRESPESKRKLGTPKARAFRSFRTSCPAILIGCGDVQFSRTNPVDQFGSIRIDLLDPVDIESIRLDVVGEFPKLSVSELREELAGGVK